GWRNTSNDPAFIRGRRVWWRREAPVVMRHEAAPGWKCDRYGMPWAAAGGGAEAGPTPPGTMKTWPRPVPSPPTFTAPEPGTTSLPSPAPPASPASPASASEPEPEPVSEPEPEPV